MQIVMSDWWWLSYADDDGFRGALIIRGKHFLDACLQARVAHLSPGGQVIGAQIQAAALDEYYPESQRNRLLSKEECIRHGHIKELP